MRRRRRKPKVVNRNHHLELPKDDRPIPDPGPWSAFDNWHPRPAYSPVRLPDHHTIIGSL